MAGRIVGITVEIGGSTTGLSKALESVNKTIKNTQSRLKDLEIDFICTVYYGNMLTKLKGRKA